jgi:protein O-mannosyl-transferase
MKRRRESESTENAGEGSPENVVSAGGKHSPQGPAQSPKASSQHATMLAAIVILAAGMAAYANSFSGPFVFDGILCVAENPAMHKLWPPWAPMIGTARPTADWSFAVNYALDGTNAWGYHAVNLAIHLAAALALFAIVRRTLLSGRLATRFGPAAWGVALAVAVLWLVHPLQTQSVTYIYQRYESLMGLFILLTLYSFIRAQDASRPNRWYAASAACCLLAVTTKEVAAVAPLLILWYDRALVASSWREIVRRRSAYYAGLAGAWVILAGLMLGQADKYAGAGILVVKNVTPLQYAVSQPGVIAHYLRLCFWPTGLCLDYGWPVAATAGAIVLPSLLIAVLSAIAVWAIFRWPEWSFLGAWFFLILAPTSSVFPIRDLAFEHRMYLPLAAVVAGMVIGGCVVGQMLVGWERMSRPALPVMGYSLLMLTGVALGMLTFQRNADYRSDLSIWEDTLAKAPDNERVHFNLGEILDRRGRINEAIAQYRRTLEIRPDNANAHTNLGIALANCGQADEAIAHFREVLKIMPDYAEVHCNLSISLLGENQVDEAIVHLRRALDINPNLAAARNYLASALASTGQFDEAIVQWRKALEVNPGDAGARINLGIALANRGQTDEAIAHFREVLKIMPDYAEVHYNLSLSLLEKNQLDEAISHLRRALDINPYFAEAHNQLGSALARSGQFDAAVTHYQKALDINPNYAEARRNLADALNQKERAK